eukprot:TRINITY_DN4685_c0_g1_i1.p1 TRINITY_DN4685_c0_g1~~TRINITY_DN4685_c0_g1_i1.p1  ORF type:complete len:315 (-),score=55.40 TRINITY_DN4685_c0_g1_i1:624-1568(-)
MTRFIGVDYYGILEVSRDAQIADVNKSFRALALKFHPSLAPPDKQASAAHSFRSLCEAYAVISDPRLRSIYDAYGHAGLADPGVAWQFDGDCDGIFRRFFGTDNPFVFMDDQPHHFFSSKHRNAVAAKIAPLRTIHVNCSVRELFLAAPKTVAFDRCRFLDSGASVAESVKVRVPLKRGMLAGSTVVLPQQGDFHDGHTPGDLQVVIDVPPDGPMVVDPTGDITLRHPLSLKDALCGAAVAMDGLDGRKVSVRITEIVSPSYVRVVSGEGLWRPDGRTRGDLRVVFDIEFPRSLSATQREELGRILSMRPDSRS